MSKHEDVAAGAALAALPSVYVASSLARYAREGGQDIDIDDLEIAPLEFSAKQVLQSIADTLRITRGGNWQVLEHTDAFTGEMTGLSIQKIN